MAKVKLEVSCRFRNQESSEVGVEMGPVLRSERSSE